MYAKNNYNSQRHWSDQFLPSVMDTLGGGHTEVEITPFIVDVEQAADLIIKAGEAENKDEYVAVRLRKSKFASRYPFEFTVRYQYTAGYKTEYEKIMEGFADLMFYGFVVNNQVARWILLDMDRFREEAENDYIIKEHKHNRDGRNSFLAFDVRSFKSDIIISHSVGYFG
jgi:hypothetical protein